jgi:hypothetical protein
LEVSADGELLVLELVEVGLGIIEVAADLAERRAADAADIGQEAVDVALVVILVGRIEVEPRIGIRRPGQVRGDEAAEIVGIVGVGVAALKLAEQAIAPDAVLGQPVADVEGAVTVRIVVDAALDIADALAGGALGDRVDEATRIGAAVEHRGRAAHDLDPLELERVDDEAAEGVGIKVQRVEIDAGLRGVEAADVEPVGVGVGAVGLREHAGRVAQRLVDLLDAAVVEFLAAEHRDRLRHLDQRRVGLRAGRGVPRDVAVHRPGACPAGGATGPAVGLHHDRVQHDLAAGLRRCLRQGRKADGGYGNEQAGAQIHGLDPVGDSVCEPSHEQILTPSIKF